MHSIFEKDNINFSDSGGYINNVSEINLISAESNVKLNCERMKQVDPAGSSYLNKIHASDLEVYNHMYVAGHVGVGAISAFQDSSVFGNLKIGSQENTSDLNVYGNINLVDSNGSITKIDPSHISQLKNSIDASEIRVLDTDGNQAFAIDANFIKDAKYITESHVAGDMSAHKIVASDISVSSLTITDKITYGSDGIEGLASSKIFFDAPTNIGDYHSGMIAIVKPSESFWLIKFSAKVGLFKIKKRTVLFLNKSEPKSIKSFDKDDIKELISAYSGIGYWEPLYSEEYDSSIFQCVLELNFE